jgi:hypothetical protein
LFGYIWRSVLAKPFFVDANGQDHRESDCFGGGQLLIYCDRAIQEWNSRRHVAWIVTRPCLSPALWFVLRGLVRHQISHTTGRRALRCRVFDAGSNGASPTELGGCGDLNQVRGEQLWYAIPPVSALMLSLMFGVVQLIECGWIKVMKPSLDFTKSIRFSQLLST